MVSRNDATNFTPEISGAKGRRDVVTIQILRHFDIINGLIIREHFEPMDWITILLQFFFLHRGPFNVNIEFDEASCAGLRSRPYFVAPLLDCLCS